MLDKPDATLVPFVRKDIKPGRDGKGRFVKGFCPNPNGRPKEALAELCRKVTSKRRLVDILGSIGAGVGSYRRAPLSDRIRAIEILLGFGCGRPTSEAHSEELIMVV